MYINLPKFISFIFLLSLLLTPQSGLAQNDKVQNTRNDIFNLNDQKDVQGRGTNSDLFFPDAISYIDENFETAVGVTPPSGWTQNIIVGEEGVDLWHFDNPGGRNLVAPVTAPAAIFDANYISGNGQPENVTLESPSFTPSAVSPVMLEWYQYVNNGGLPHEANVEVWNGSTWEPVFFNNSGTVNPEFHLIDITSQVAGVTDARIRFNWFGNGGGFWIIDNVLVYETGGTPQPAAAVSPIDGAIDVDINSPLEWAAGIGSEPTGYRLYFGTDGGGITPPTNIENNSDLTLTTIYTPSAPLSYDTTYYWMIIPYNDEGDATGNEIWSFTAMTDPPITTFPYLEEFEDSFPPLYYIRYTGILQDPIALTATSSGWIQGDWQNSTSPVNKAAMINTDGNSLNYWLTTALIDLGTGTDYQFEFDLTLNTAGTSDPPENSGTDDKFAMVISTDGGETWLYSNILRMWDNTGSPNVFNDIDYTGEHITIDLSGYSGIIQIGFYFESTIVNADNDLMIDNIEVKEIPSAEPEFVIDPSEIDFGYVALGDSSTLQAVVTNPGTQDLIISGITSSDAQFTYSSVSFPVTIAAGDDEIFNITFAPSTLGNQTGSLEFVHNADGSPSVYNLLGTGVDDGPTFMVDPISLNFGNAGINTSIEMTLTVTNTGLSNTLEITDASIAEDGFSVIPATASIAAGEDQIFTVTFNPISAGNYSANLIFIGNDPSSPHIISLSGYAVATDISGLVFQTDTVYQQENNSYTQTLQLKDLNPLSGKLQAIQFRLAVNKIADDNTILTFQNIQKGGDISDDNWVLDYNVYRGPITGNGASVDSVLVLLYNLDQDGGLDPSQDYNDLFTVKYRIANLPPLMDTLKSSIAITYTKATAHNGYQIDITPSQNELAVMVLNRIISLGDVNGDGFLDILDLVMVVDHIVGRDSLTGDYFTRADIAPWYPENLEPEPDGLVDVQDLSLIQDIILTNLYPDNSKNNGGGSLILPKHTGITDAKLKLYINTEGITVYIDSKVDIRGAQIELNNVTDDPGDMRINTELGKGYYFKEDTFLRVLLYDRFANEYLKAGEHYMADLPFFINNPEEVKPYKIVLVDNNNQKLENVEIETIYEEAPPLPLDYILFQNYPNPFNPVTTVKFQVPLSTEVTIKIYNLLGQEVKTLFTKHVQRGTYLIQWDGTSNSGVKLGSGTYVYRMIAGSFVKSNKMILVK